MSKITIKMAPTMMKLPLVPDGRHDASHGYMEYRIEGSDEVLLTIVYEVHPGMPGKLLVKNLLESRAVPPEVDPSEVSEFWARCILALANYYNIAADNVEIEGGPEAFFADGWFWDAEPLTKMFQDRIEFVSRYTMALDANLVPFQAEWVDNLGGMANAIFWLEDNWESHLSAQGDRLLPDGRREMWVYSSLTGLLIHRTAEGTVYEIDRTKMVKIVNGNRDGATIYRPFFESQGNYTSANKLPQVEWLKTREVVVVKDDHPHRVPLYLGEAYKRIADLLQNRPFRPFKNIKLDALLVDLPVAERKTRLTGDQVRAYEELLAHLELFKTSKDFTPHHMPSYWSMMTFIKKFNGSIDPFQSIEAFYAIRMTQIVDDLLTVKDDLAATVIWSMCFYSPFDNSRTEVEKRKATHDRTFDKTENSND